MLRNLANLSVVAVAATWVCDAAAQASWQNGASLAGTCTQNTGTGSNSGNYNNTYGCVSGGSTATASAWSTDRGTDTWMNGTGTVVRNSTTRPGTGYVPQAQAGGGFANAFLGSYSGGLGVASRTEVIGIGSPDHSIDSYTPGTQDLVLVSFSGPVVLNKIQFGYSAADTDFTLLRWTGNSSPVDGTGATGQGIYAGTGGTQTLNSTVGANAWSVVGNYADLAVGALGTVNAGAAGSSWWLISTYNSGFGGTCTDFNGTGTGKGDGCSSASADSFKLQWLQTAAFTCASGTATAGGSCTTTGGGGAAPEPMSLALVGAALLGATSARRRASRRA